MTNEPRWWAFLRRPSRPKVYPDGPATNYLHRDGQPGPHDNPLTIAGQVADWDRVTDYLPVLTAPLLTPGQLDRAAVPAAPAPWPLTVL